MLHETLSPETARERARRIWRNSRILRELDLGDGGGEPTTAGPTTGRSIRVVSIFKSEIRRLFSTKTSMNLMHYEKALQRRRRKLLLEKLRRLENGIG